MLNLLLNIDKFLTTLIFSLPHNFILNYFFGFFSVKGVYIFIWIILFLYLILIEEKKDKRFIFYFIASLLISSLLVFSMKNLIKRPRPYYQSPITSHQPPITNSQLRITNYKLLNYPTDYSFPSGHATISFAAAGILAFFDKKRKKYFYLIAIVIGFSRVYLGYHYFSDVIIGAGIGWLISAAISKINIINAKFKSQNEK